MGRRDEETCDTPMALRQCHNWNSVIAYSKKPAMMDMIHNVTRNPSPTYPLFTYALYAGGTSVKFSTTATPHTMIPHGATQV